MSIYVAKTGFPWSLGEENPRGLGWNGKLSPSVSFFSLFVPSPFFAASVLTPTLLSLFILETLCWVTCFTTSPHPMLFCFVPNSSLQQAERWCTGQSPLEAASLRDLLCFPPASLRVCHWPHAESQSLDSKEPLFHVQFIYLQVSTSVQIALQGPATLWAWCSV